MATTEKTADWPRIAVWAVGCAVMAGAAAVGWTVAVPVPPPPQEARKTPSNTANRDGLKESMDDSVHLGPVASCDRTDRLGPFRPGPAFT